MSDAALLTGFLKSFVLPLVGGGRVQVRGLIGPGMLQRFRSGGPPDATVLLGVMEHVRTNLAHLGPALDEPLLPDDVIALAVVWHNLLSMTHPETVGRMRLRKRVRRWCQAMVAWIGAPRSTHEIALRHGVFARLGDVGRVDTEVRFWAGNAKFVGITPPKRLMYWPTLRKVQEKKTRHSLWELLAPLAHVDDDRDLVTAAHHALALSPLTDVSLAARPKDVAAFCWTSASINMLGDPPLRGAAVRALLRAQANAEAEQAPLPAIERATRELCAGEIPAPIAQMLTAFHLELLVTQALAQGSPPKGHTIAWDALARLDVSRAARIVGLDLARLQRTLDLEAHPRYPLNDAPAGPVLARAGFSEVMS